MVTLSVIETQALDAAEQQQSHLRASDYRVVACPLSAARRLIVTHHYARGMANTATYCHGLYALHDPYTLLGAAWWIPPTRAAAEATWPEAVGGPQSWQRVLSLSRIVIAPGLPTNAASFLIGRSISAIRADARFDCLVTYADQWRGHTGAIYRATNWEYLGVTPPETVWVDPRTNRLVARKAGPHTRTRAEMLALGYHDLGRFGKHKFRLVLRDNKGYAMRRHTVASDAQPSLWDASETTETPGIGEKRDTPRMPVTPRDATQDERHAIRRRARHTTDAASPESQINATPVQPPQPQPQSPPQSQPLRTIPLVWGKWPSSEDEALVVVGEPPDQRWAFAGQMACGKELLGVLLAPWERRAERARVAQRWVAIERVRRVVVDVVIAAAEEEGESERDGNGSHHDG